MSSLRIPIMACVTASIAFGVLAAPALVRDLSVQTAVSSKRPFVGEPVVLELTVRQNTSKLPEIDAAELEALGAKLRGEPARSQFRQSINGVVTEEYIFQFRYQFVPQRAGKITIPSATIRQGNEKAASDPVEIEAIAQDWAFVEIVASERAVYPGQTITLTVQILLRQLVHDGTTLENDPFGGREPPQLRIPWLGGAEILEASKSLGDSLKKRAKEEGPSFAVNDLFQRTNLMSFFDERVSQDGIRFDRDTVERTGLDGQKFSYYRYSLPLEYRATRSGTIGPLVAQLRGPIFVGVHREGRELVADRRDVTTVSPPITLTVLSVPKAGQPATFTGGVGSFKIAAAAQPTSVRVGDPITLTVRVTGSGTIEDVGPPNLAVQEKWTTNFKVHEDASQRMEDESKIFTYSIRPRSVEAKELPAIKLSYFNPKLKKYEDTYTERIPLTVSETARLDPSEIVDAAPASKGNRTLEELSGGLAPNYTGLELLEPQGSYSLSARGWYTVILSPPLIWLAVGAWHTQAVRRRQNPGLIRARMAQRRAVQRLDAAAAGPPLLVPNEIAHALAGYLADRLDQAAGELTPAEARHRANLLGASLPLADQTANLIEQCDQARFARSASQSVAGELLRIARDIISELERIGSVRIQDRSKSSLAAIHSLLLCWTVIVFGIPANVAAADRFEVVEILTQAAAAFDRGVQETDAAAARRHFDEAITAYEKLAALGIENGKLYYNLGNAYFRIGDVPRAILNYRIAERLLPRDELIRNNLRTARDRLPDRIEPTETHRLLRQVFFAHHIWNIRERTQVAAGAFTIAWLLLGTRIFCPRRWLSVSGLTCLTIATALGVSVRWQTRNELEHPIGVLIAEEVVRKGNGETYEPQFDRPLSPGVEFRVLERRNEWLQIGLADEKSGWVRKSHVTTISD